MRVWTFSVVSAAVLLSACETVTSETNTPMVLEKGFNAGERYILRQRTVQGPNGPYEQTSVVYRGLARPCIADSPKDCESVAGALIDEYEDSVFF